MKRGLSLWIAALLCVALAACGRQKATPDSAATSVALNRLATLQAGALPTSTPQATTPQPATATSLLPAAAPTEPGLAPTVPLTATAVSETPIGVVPSSTPAVQPTSGASTATAKPGASATPGASETATVTPSPTSTAPAQTPVALANQIAFVSNRDGNQEIYRMSAADGTGVTRLTDNPAEDGYPAWSPDGTRIAFVSNRDGQYDIYVMDVSGGSLQRLTTSPAVDSYPSWVDLEHIVFSSDRDEAENLNLYVMKADGTEVTPLTNEAGWETNARWSPAAVRFAFLSGTGDAQELYLMDRDGANLTPVTSEMSLFLGFPSWSPDGGKIVFSDGWMIYVINADGTGFDQLTTGEVLDDCPDWSPDGARIAFASDRDSPAGELNYEIYVMGVDGSNPRRLTDSPASDMWPVWSPQ